MNTTKKAFSWALVLALLLGACRLASLPAEPTKTEQPTVPELPTSEKSATESVPVEPTSVSTEEPPTPTPEPVEPAFSQEELIDRWYTPIASTAFVMGLCQGLDEMVTGEETGTELFGGALAFGIVIQASQEGLDEWQPADGLEEYKTQTEGYINELEDLASKWYNEEISSSEFKTEVSSVCIDLEAYVETIGEAARAEGLNEESMTEIGTRMEEAFAEMGETDQPDEPRVIQVPSDVGFSRSNPFPPGEVHSVPNWEISVVETVRGDEAWQMLEAAYSYNDPPPDGYEYALVKLNITNTSVSEEEVSIGTYDFKLTGDRSVAYTAPWITLPEPQLDAKLFSGGNTEGWIGFQVEMGEGNLVLVLDEVANWEDDRFRYFAIYEGASVSISEELLAVVPNELGTSRQEPAPIGETVITNDWEVTILEVVKGEEAWQALLEANDYNDPPEDGMQYLLVKVKVRYQVPTEGYESTTNNTFEVTGELGKVYENPYLVNPEPNLDAYLFPGGEFTGWLSFQAAEGEGGLMLMFSPWLDWENENRRYLSLGQ